MCYIPVWLESRGGSGIASDIPELLHVPDGVPDPFSLAAIADVETPDSPDVTFDLAELTTASLEWILAETTGSYAYGLIGSEAHERSDPTGY